MTVLLSVSSTLEPDTSAAMTLLAEPSIVTVKAEGAAVVEESDSLKVRTTLVPSVEVAAEEKLGAMTSGEPFTPDIANEIVSLLDKDGD